MSKKTSNRRKSLAVVGDRGKISRRGFAGLSAAAAAVAATGCSSAELEKLSCEGFLLPPKGATVQTTACAYCIVGCGYKAYSWPVGEASGGLDASENALGVQFPVEPMSGNWISPQMYNIVTREGQPHHLVVVPDAQSEVVNRGGDHNLGASLAQRFYREDGGTRDRLLRPQLRIGEELLDIGWDEAIAILGEVTKHILATKGPLAWGMKTYSYQFYENTYAITKLAFEGIRTPCWSSHDQPAEGSSTPGLSDAGINAFSASYQDWLDSDVLFVSGCALYDQRAILFSQWVAGGPTLIVVNPIRDETADYALENGGLFLQVVPGTDTLLQNAIAYVILDEGWHDESFIAASCVGDAEILEERTTSTRRGRFGVTFSEYRDFILAEPMHQPENAASITGISAAQIREAAELLARPRAGVRPKSSLMLEKGNYWSHNYSNSASFASLGLLVGAGNRPGQMMSRGGGHQRGMLKAASYPEELSPERRNGEQVPLNLDAWLLRGNLSLAWAIGCTWMGGGSAHTDALFEQTRRQARGSNLPQLTVDSAYVAGAGSSLDFDSVVATLKSKIDAGGMFFVQQDIYPQAITELADLVLPAVSWGEAPFTRMQGERRLRHYAKLADAPGEARPDWRVIADLAAYLGIEGFDWADENAIFVEGAARSAGKANDYVELVRMAEEQGIRAHDVLAELGTTGLQCPIRREGEALVGTIRLHEEGFSTASGKALFVRADYQELVQSRDSELAPRPGELLVTNRRFGTRWSSLVEDSRNPYRASLGPENLVEMHPEDAAALGISEGDRIFISTDRLMSEDLVTENPNEVGGMQATATISDVVLPGVVCAYFNFMGAPEGAANSVVPNSVDPVSGLYSFKLGRGRITKIG